MNGAPSRDTPHRDHDTENFPTASLILAKGVRAQVMAFYRFVRTADDVADHATLPPAEKIARLGAAGIVLFSYDSLIDPQQSAPGYLATVSRAVFADRGATESGDARDSTPGTAPGAPHTAPRAARSAHSAPRPAHSASRPTSR